MQNVSCGYAVWHMHNVYTIWCQCMSALTSKRVKIYKIYVDCRMFRLSYIFEVEYNVLLNKENSESQHIV